LRRDSVCVHSQGSFQAPSREISVCMGVPIAKRFGPASPRLRPPLATLATPPLAPVMEKFIIEGGVPLSGTVTPAGNKNGALPILAACLLTDDEVVLRNVPRISDVEAMCLLLEVLGARVTWTGPGEVRIDPSTVDSQQVDRGL